MGGRGRSALPLEDDKGRDEEAAGGHGHQDDGVAVGALGGGWRGGGVVEALGAALGVDGERAESCEEQAGRQAQACCQA